MIIEPRAIGVTPGAGAEASLITTTQTIALPLQWAVGDTVIFAANTVGLATVPTVNAPGFSGTIRYLYSSAAMPFTHVWVIEKSPVAFNGTVTLSRTNVGYFSGLGQVYSGVGRVILQNAALANDSSLVSPVLSPLVTVTNPGTMVVGAFGSQGAFQGNIHFPDARLLAVNFIQSYGYYNTTLQDMVVGGAGTYQVSADFEFTNWPPVGSISRQALALEPDSTAPDFTLSSNQSSLSLDQGASGQAAITINPTGGFMNPVDLTVTGLPSGVSASWNPNPATSSSVLTLTATSGAVVGPVTITITGTSDGLSDSIQIALTVNPPPNFALSSSLSGFSIIRGGSGYTDITITPVGTFAGSVNLAVTGLPSGVSAQWSVNPATSASRLTLSATTTAALGAVNLQITGTSATLSNSIPLSLTVNAQPGFNLSTYPSTFSITQGDTINVPVSISPQGGFSGSVNLSASGLPSGVTGYFTPNPATTGSILTLTAGASSPVGPVVATIQGISGSVSASTTFLLAVYAPKPPLDPALIRLATGLLLLRIPVEIPLQ